MSRRNKKNKTKKRKETVDLDFQKDDHPTIQHIRWHTKLQRQNLRLRCREISMRSLAKHNTKQGS